MIDPAFPRAFEVLRCRAQGDVLDDPDFDAVAYRYVWRVNGQVVRDRTSAGRSDQLAAGIAPSGAFVTCDVTPTDGQDVAATTRASVQVLGRRMWVPPGRRP